ncbi:MAG: hypothetical protein RIR18_1300 [Pseudomonadota bacterium]
MSHPVLRGLYAITPDITDTHLLIEQVQAALTGGCRLVQYRDKLTDAPTRRLRAQQLLDCCRSANATLIINDDVELALQIGADGVHLGGEDGDWAAARSALGPNRILGTSCYADLANAEKAVAAGASYVAFGAMFPSATKPNAPSASLELAGRAHHQLPIPICAIGGITVDNVASLLITGVDMVAVITNLFLAPNIAARAAEFQRLFQET